MIAYAIEVSVENKQAIVSEHPKFDSQEFDWWLEEHCDGYFIRDSSSVFDCHYIDKDLFSQMYIFTHPNSGDLFKRIVKL